MATAPDVFPTTPSLSQWIPQVHGLKKPPQDCSLTSSTALTRGLSAILELSPDLLSDLLKYPVPT